MEQDLLISRALLELFSDEHLASSFAFRGGTALHKLHLAPAVRYSEDLDLVQLQPRPIGEAIDRIRAILAPWLGEPRRKQANRNTTLIFRADSEIPPVVRLRLKVEMNCREHSRAHGVTSVPCALRSRWLEGECKVTTYPLDESLGTELRALYQRRKGRDLFDLWYALMHGQATPGRVVASFEGHMREDGLQVSRREYEGNVAAKLTEPDFLRDTDVLLRPGVSYDPELAWSCVRERLIDRLG